MEAQEIYDKVKTHLLKQNRRSKERGGQCLYRGPGGTACAVGCLLTDKEAERLAVDNWSAEDAIAKGQMPKRLVRHGELLSRLQRVHDENPPRAWSRELKEVAADYRLTP